jgi:hypothetical protein
VAAVLSAATAAAAAAAAGRSSATVRRPQQLRGTRHSQWRWSAAAVRRGRRPPRHHALRVGDLPPPPARTAPEVPALGVNHRLAAQRWVAGAVMPEGHTDCRVLQLCGGVNPALPLD